MSKHDNLTSTLDKLPHMQWRTQWQQTTKPFIHWQFMWAECLTETWLVEATYLHRLACSGQRLLVPQYGSGDHSDQQPDEGYHQALKDAADAYHERTRSMAKLYSKLGKQLWEVK